VDSYITFRRALAVSESLSLRAWARLDRLPVFVPIDYWSAWCEHPQGITLEWCPPCDRYVQSCDHLDDDVMPSTDVLTDLRSAGLTYRQIGARYDIDPGVVCRHFNKVTAAA
jgi:hypothetical protein